MDIGKCIYSFAKDLLRQLKKSMEDAMQAKKPVPANKREVKNEKKAFARTEKTVKEVAKDTNKTRRKMVKPTKGGNK